MRSLAQRLVGLVLVTLFVVGTIMPSVLHDDIQEPRSSSYVERQRNRLTGDLIAYQVRQGRPFRYCPVGDSVFSEFERRTVGCFGW